MPAEVSDVVLQYLRSHGYKDAADAFNKRLLEEKKKKAIEGGDKGNDVTPEGASQSDDQTDTEDQSASLEEYAANIGLNTEDVTANYILFNAASASKNASKYPDCYEKFLDWVANSLDMYKLELYHLTYPVLVYSYLEMVAKHQSSSRSIL